MMSNGIRILLLADTHLGFDLPFRPRVQRRRRGPDFFDNFQRALQPAHDGDVDVVVHGGDLFFRTRVPEELVEMAIHPLVEVADIGVPVYLVPGNHERSRIPLRLWGTHPNLHIFNRPRNFATTFKGVTLAFCGFPFERRVRDKFIGLVDQTGWREVEADHCILCIHQAVEGAQVGVQNYTFRGGQDVVRGRDIPVDLTAVLSGHIHRSQVLTRNMDGNPLGAAVIYPGSTERTSFAEREETKQYAIIELGGAADIRAALRDIRFVTLPTRPMVNLILNLEAIDVDHLLGTLQKELSALDPDSVVRIQVVGETNRQIERRLTAPTLRSLAPESMNVTLAYRTKPPASC
ncbi:MAG: metallophosphoesterase [Chloroflexota bacterium]|nr:metallophosphoesterase [Chloroflexota bacterium]